MDQSKRQFLAETEDLIEQIFGDLDALREASSENERLRLIDALFRRIHRIKGSAASFGCESLHQIAHEFESLLSAVREGRVSTDSDVFDACESATTALAESLHVASTGGTDASHQSLFDHMKALTRRASSKFDSDNEEILEALPSEIRQALTADEKRRLVREKLMNLFIVTAIFDTADFDDQFRALKNELAEHGEVIATLPTMGVTGASDVTFKLLYAAETSAENLNETLKDFRGVAATKIDTSKIHLPAALPSQIKATMESETRSPASKLVRIDTEELDKLISTTHELSRTTSKALQLALSQKASDNLIHKELERLDEKITRAFLDVEKELLDLRMISAGRVLQRAARAGRGAARLSSKRIDFKIVGDNLRLDRLLCETIADPLIHLVRNAVDHGIESGDGVSEEKSKRPTVIIEAAVEGGQTCVRVTDNGRGVDPELVSRAAVRLGIIDDQTTVDMERSLRLIFRPGFTTLSSLSSISGRGVGLDVVETAVEQMGGEVRVRSEPGKGSTFEMRLPANVGLLDATVVTVAGNCYCIDSRQIIVRKTINEVDVASTASRETVRIGDEVLVLRRLAGLLGNMQSESVNGSVSVIVCECPDEVTGDFSASKVAILVDEVRGTEEVLVRNLGRHAARWRGVAGATELHDGQLALVLDLKRLLTVGLPQK